MLGFDALGRLVLGQIGSGSNGRTNLTGVAGGGVAGTIGNFALSLIISGAAGAGVAGTITGSLQKALTGAAAPGSAGIVTPSVATALVGVAGVGAGGQAGNLLVPGLVGVAGGGVAGTLRDTITLVVSGVAATGLAGTITANPGGNFSGAYGTGLAGDIRIVTSGGGGNEPLRGRNRRKGGFEPVKKRYGTVEEPEQRAPAIVPPFVPKAPTIVPYGDPIPVPEDGRADVPDLIASIRQAELASSILRALDELSMIDQQDAEDVAALMADIPDLLAIFEAT